MIQTGIQIITINGMGTLADIPSPEKFFPESSDYRCSTNEKRYSLYLPDQGGTYAVQRHVVSRKAEMKEIDNRLRSEFSVDDARMIFVYDGKLCENGELWLCTEAVTPLPKRENEPVKTVTALCRLVTKYYKSVHEAHGNIHPGNVFVGTDDSRILGVPALSGKRGGDLAFCAPEVLRGKTPDTASDVYSLGMFLWYCLKPEKVQPFLPGDRWGYQGDSLPFADGTPKDLQKIVRKALSLEPTKRYDSPETMLNKLEEYAAKHSVQRKKQQDSLRKVLLGTGIAVVVLLAGGAALTGVLQSYDPGAKEIREMMESDAYTLAYREILKREPGETTDTLIVEYINNCLDDRDYARAAQILPELSDAAFEGEGLNALEEIFRRFAERERLDALAESAERLAQRNEAAKKLAEEYFG